jgi:hypothetical protein
VKNWMRGADCTDPIVSLLEQLSQEHHELLDLVTCSCADEHQARRAEEVRSLASTHLRNEAEMYSSLTALVDPRLVDTFEGGHERIDDALNELAAREPDGETRDRAMTELERAVADQIRLEETLLFPVVLAALARGRGTRSTRG